ncbi:hypothetical protein CVT25_002811 [Psilocybe cyanescens]|uniref:F-box domain-containing protein n=1 Tax=Psilocybe cyanescens TaxID=93625 RepID=A0A409WL45_PSICY|nr:hypothetical protein CVT25_002811 [Psilocybe cyanescens]
MEMPLPLSVLDADIESYREYTRILCTYRNTLAPISKLPTEVMGYIFLLYQRGIQGPDVDLYEATSTDHPKRPRDYGMPLEWIKLGHVSYHWRAMALSLTPLWTHISLKNLQWVDEMISTRSRGCDLVFRDAVDSYEDIESSSTFLAHCLPRLREIDLAVFHTLRYVFHPETVLDATAAPHLSCLRLACTPAPNDATDHDILAKLLSRTAVLRVLEIDFPLKWHSPSLSDITHLKVSHGSHIKAPSPSELFDALSCMEHLQVLHLVGDALPVRPDEPPKVFSNLERQRPYLPAMLTLILNGSIDSLYFFLENVDIPQTAQIRLKSSRCPERADVPYVSMIVSRIKQMYWPSRYASQPGFPIHSLDISFSNEDLLSHDALRRLRAHILRLKAWDAAPSTGVQASLMNDPTYAVDNLIDLELPWWPHNTPARSICQDAPSLLSDICYTLPCKSLTALSFRVRDDTNITNLFTVSDTFFLDVFGPQTELRSFYTNPPVLQSLLLNMSPPTTIAANAIPQRRMTAESPPTILFPHLRLLHVTNNFRSCLSEQAFCTGLYARARSHMRLDTLSIPRLLDPDGPYSSVAVLSQQVTNLVQRAR